MAQPDKAAPPETGHRRNAIVIGVLLALGLGWGAWCLAQARLGPPTSRPRPG
ncbi:hypothetical protein WJ966_15080 [Achromobacter xylosoxidans]